MSSASSDRWEKLSPYLDEALAMSEEQRAAWLETLRGQDAALAADIAAMLDEERAVAQEKFLEHTIFEIPGRGSVAGQKIGVYTLTAPIGQGGMSTVWLAERNDGRFQGRVAIKFLNFAVSGAVGQAR
ncbi:MAG: hypothetical protein ACRD3E_12700, partial [Terriglobales bacterium]